jgi:hypothetical protein
VSTYFRRDDQNWTALNNSQHVAGLKNPPKDLDSTLGGQFEGASQDQKLASPYYHCNRFGCCQQLPQLKVLSGHHDR